MFFDITRTVRRGLPVLLLLAVAGCATKTEINYTTTTSSGERVTFHMINGLADHAKAGGIETGTPQLEPDIKGHRICYDLRLFDQGNRPLRSVRVEDVSDEKPFLLLEDQDPKTVEGRWERHSPWFKLTDPAMKWLTYLDNSFRVYRFTVVFADGRSVVLHEGVMIPGMAKNVMRRVLGENY